MAHATYAKTLPADLGAPAFVSAWRTRALTVGAIFGVIGLILAFLAGDHFQHLLRSWLLGFMITLGFSIGGMALLMVQYLSGGKWGLLVRRPLEAMSRTLGLPFLYFIPIAVFAPGSIFGPSIPTPSRPTSRPDHLCPGTCHQL